MSSMRLSNTIARLTRTGPRIDLVRACASEAARRDSAEVEQSAETKQLVKELCRAKAKRPT